MVYYIVLPFIAALSGIFLEKAGEKGRIIYSVFFGLLIFLTQALRSYVGADYHSYAELYDYLNFTDMEDVTGLAHEKGFLIPMKLLNSVFYERYAMFAVIALAVAAGITVYIYKYSPVPWISAVSFLCFGPFFYSMNFMRQFISAIIVMYAFEYVRTRNFFKFLVLVLLASCFHWAALVMIPFYFIFRIEMNLPVLIAYVSFGAVLFYGSDFFIELGINIFYTKYKSEYIPDLKTGVSLIYPVGYTALFIAVFLMRKSLCKKNKHNNMYISCLFFISMFEFLGAKHAMLSRFGLFFVVPPLLALMPDIVTATGEMLGKKLGEKNGRLAACAAYCVFAVFFLIQLLAVNSNGVVPYSTVFGE